jgi:hypothetical protein
MDLSWFVFVGIYGGVVTLVVWPRYWTGRRFLLRWHIGEPDDAQIATAVRYLRRRRLPVVPLLLLTGAVLAALGFAPSGGSPQDGLAFLAALLVALLLAELLPAIRPVPDARPSRPPLVPSYAVRLYATLLAVTVAAALAGLAAQPAADRTLDSLPPNRAGPDGSGIVLADSYRTELANPTGWLIIVTATLAALVVLAVVRIAHSWRADPDERLDLVLRVRTARVGVGLGIAVTAALGTAAVDRLGRLANFVDGNPIDGGAITGTFPVAGPDFPAVAAPPAWLQPWPDLHPPLGLALLIAGILGWAWVANPPRRLPAPAA